MAITLRTKLEKARSAIQAKNAKENIEAQKQQNKLFSLVFFLF